MTLINLATQTGARPSDLLGIDDPYTAYCLDEVCLFMVEQAKDKKEPDFNRPARLERQAREGKGEHRTTNADMIEALAGLGVMVRR